MVPEKNLFVPLWNKIMMIFPCRARRFMFKCRRAAEKQDVVPCKAPFRWSQLHVPRWCPPTSLERPSCFNLRFQKSSGLCEEPVVWKEKSADVKRNAGERNPGASSAD